MTLFDFITVFGGDKLSVINHYGDMFHLYNLHGVWQYSGHDLPLHLLATKIMIISHTKTDVVIGLSKYICEKTMSILIERAATKHLDVFRM